jgi:hypothetical protein
MKLSGPVKRETDNPLVSAIEYLLVVCLRIINVVCCGTADGDKNSSVPSSRFVKFIGLPYV